MDSSSSPEASGGDGVPGNPVNPDDVEGGKEVERVSLPHRHPVGFAEFSPPRAQMNHHPPPPQLLNHRSLSTLPPAAASAILQPHSHPPHQTPRLTNTQRNILYIKSKSNQPYNCKLINNQGFTLTSSYQSITVAWGQHHFQPWFPRAIRLRIRLRQCR